MSYIKFPCKYILLFSVLFAAIFLSAEKDEKKENYKESDIVYRTAIIFYRKHFASRSLDDELSEDLFYKYFDILDPNKIFFTRKDLRNFSEYKLKLDEQIAEGNADFAYKVYDFYISRLKKYKEFANDLLGKGFDYSKEEYYTADRSEMPRAENLEELKKIWRKKLKFEKLNLLIAEKARKVEKEKSNEKSKEHVSWEMKSPSEKMHHRTVQLLKYAETKNRIDILELFLLSLGKIYGPHSAYMSPRTEQDFDINMSLSLEGIGAVLETKNGYIRVVRIVPGGPAEKQGELKAGDRIIAVAQNEKRPVNVIDMPLSKAVMLIRGKKDSLVKLTVLDGRKGINAIPKQIAIQRDKVQLKDSDVSSEIKEIKVKGKTRKIGVLTIPSFYLDFNSVGKGKKAKSTTRDALKEIKKLSNKRIDGLIVDIRNNGGGSLLEAITLSGLFVESGPVLQVKDAYGKLDTEFSRNDDIAYSGPMIVLSNKLSASASEIFSGAMKDYKRALLVGDRKSHGKGTVQNIIELGKNMGSVKYTMAKFYRVNGASTQLKGVESHIVLPNFTDVMKIGEDKLENPLPWEKLEKLDYLPYNSDICSDEVIAYLRNKAALRRKNSEEFKKIYREIDIYNKVANRKRATLNLKKAWKEHLETEKMFEHRDSIIGLNEDNDESEEDFFLEESLNIFEDFFNFQNSDKGNIRASRCSG